MSRYIKLDDAINEVAIYLSCDYPTEERARENAERLFTNVPTTEAGAGEWVVHPLMDEGRVELECSICGDVFVRAVDYRPHFCEHCGAEIKGDIE